MRIIENDSKTSIIMEDGDILEISSLKKNNETVIVKCLDSSLHIDELSLKTIKEKSADEQEIAKIKALLDKK